MQWKSFFKPVLYAISIVLFCVTSMYLWAQTADSQPTDASKSWTATTEPQVSAYVNPRRMTESHTQTDNRTVDAQNIERLGPDGRFEPYFDTEKESIRVNATSARTVVRTFGRDGGGQRALTQVTEEATESFPGGREKVVRTISTPDLDGHIPITQRDVTDTEKSGPDVRETKTTVFLSDGRGGLAPNLQIRERRTRIGDHRIEVQKTTLLPDGAGNWQVYELKESTITIKEYAKGSTTEETVSRPAVDGKLSVASYSIAKESENGPGGRQDSVETYSTDIPGLASDGNLHLSQRVTTVRRPHSDGGHATEQQLEQPNPWNPSAGLEVRMRTIEIVSRDAYGELQTRTVQLRDGSGNLKIISAETRKSNQNQAVQVSTH
jgi:hypothetical protein